MLVFESVGPYQYSTVTYKINITFNEDISLVSYKVVFYFYFLAFLNLYLFIGVAQLHLE